MFLAFHWPSVTSSNRKSKRFEAAHNNRMLFFIYEKHFFGLDTVFSFFQWYTIKNLSKNDALRCGLTSDNSLRRSQSTEILGMKAQAEENHVTILFVGLRWILSSVSYSRVIFRF